MRTVEEIKAAQGYKRGDCDKCSELEWCREQYPDPVACELEDEDAGVEVNKPTRPKS